MSIKPIQSKKLCRQCEEVFVTTSKKFINCSSCRKTEKKTDWVSKFLNSNFGLWLVNRIAEHQTFKAVDFTSNGLSELYALYKLRKKYCQYSYNKGWSSALELDLCHLYPVKSGAEFTGELSPRNLIIAPSKINRHLGNKVFEVGHKVGLPPPSKRVKGVAAVRQSIKKNKSFRGAVIAFQSTHKLKPSKKGLVEGVIEAKGKFSLMDVAENEFTRLSLNVPKVGSAEVQFMIALQGAQSLRPSKGQAICLDKDELKEQRLWATEPWVRELSDVELTTFVNLKLHLRDGEVTIQNRNFSVGRLYDSYIKNDLHNRFSCTFLNKEVSDLAYEEVVRAFTGKCNAPIQQIKIEEVVEDNW
ncbi:hypothetical protein [Shewanella japonica]|uniref:HNH endonuclease n=1 Tax=Shewanella japonica TaxID=93973 RepID=A0ABM6JP89_9GAMM|nr:hypothetical protein [Shewanella japonica]ARD24150.1 hypothetical protein SJ2017_3921 [Shewanella japonica]